jgi:hypothetical protein
MLLSLWKNGIFVKNAPMPTAMLSHRIEATSEELALNCEAI